MVTEAVELKNNLLINKSILFTSIGIFIANLIDKKLWWV